MTQEERDKILVESHSMLKEIVEFIRKTNDQKYINNKLLNSFFMGVLANLVAKKLEKLFNL